MLYANRRLATVILVSQKEFLRKFNLPNKEGRVDFPKKPGPWTQRNYINRGWQGIWEISKSYGFGEDELKGGQMVSRPFERIKFMYVDMQIGVHSF